MQKYNDCSASLGALRRGILARRSMSCRDSLAAMESREFLAS